jgi:hypothetical protein
MPNLASDTPLRSPGERCSAPSAMAIVRVWKRVRMKVGGPELWVLDHDLWKAAMGRLKRAARHRDARGSYDAATRTVGEPCESRGTPGSLGCCAHSVEAAPVGRRQIDRTGEVRNDRLRETNLMRRPTSIMRGATEPSSASEPRNRARRNFGKCLPPRTTISPRAPRRTISSYTLERVVTTIVSRAAHESI